MPDAQVTSNPPLTFRVASLVTRWSDYEALEASMRDAGFDEYTTFSPFDNTTGNDHEPFALIGELIESTAEDVLIVCHQDVRFTTASSREALGAAIVRLGTRDPRWAVCGPAGVTDRFEFIVTLDDPVDDPQRTPWSGREELCHSLDECLLIFRPRTGLRASTDLDGFHLYGTDLALRARLGGMGAYVIDLPAVHLSAGTFDERFTEATRRFAAVWQRHFLLFYTLRGGELCLARGRIVRAAAARGRVRRSVLGNELTLRLVIAQLRSRRGWRTRLTGRG